MNDQNAVATLIFVVVIVCLYGLPAIIADVRRHPSRGAIGALNMLLGWTVLGWVAALIWALSGPRHVYLAPTGPYRPGIDPLGDDPHRHGGRGR